MTLYQISNHPEKPDIYRKAEFWKAGIDLLKKRIILSVLVKHFKAIKEVEGFDQFIESDPVPVVEIVADNSMRVNPANGLVVNPYRLNADKVSESNPDYANAVPEFDFFMALPLDPALPNAGAFLETLAGQHIAGHDAQGKFGKSIYQNASVNPLL